MPLVDEDEENKNEVDRAEEDAAMAALERIKQVRVWSEIHDNFNNDDKLAAVREHRERMARDRKRKDWEAWTEETELDIDGERLIADIKNYKSEHFWQTNFYWYCKIRNFKIKEYILQSAFIEKPIQIFTANLTIITNF